MTGLEYFDILVKPEPTMVADKKNANTMTAVKTFALLGIVYGLIAAIMMIGLGGLGFIGGDPGVGALFAGLGIISLIVLPIVTAVVVVVFSYIWTGIIWIIAKALGGTGTFAQNYYLYSRVLFPAFFVGIALMIAGMIPLIGLIFGLIGFIFNLYMIWVSINVVSVANNVSKLKGLIILLIPAIILFVLLVVVIGAALLSVIGGAAGSM